MKVVERVLDKMISRIVSVDEMQFAFMPERNKRCCVYIEKDARKASCERKKVVYVFHRPSESF